MQIPGRLIVRAYTPVRRWVLLALTLVLAALALCLIYQLGRYEAGHEARQANAQRDALLQQIQQLQLDQRQMRVQLAAADEGSVAQLRERAQVERTIGDLQAQVARQQQQLQFYRGLIPQAGQNNGAIRVQQLHIAALPGTQRYAVQFVLSRPASPEQTVSGTLTLTIDGTRNASPASLNLAALSGGKLAAVPFSFRYFSEVEQDVSLPAGFRPERITLEVRPGHAGVAPYRQTFVWAVDPA